VLPFVYRGRKRRVITSKKTSPEEEWKIKDSKKREKGRKNIDQMREEENGKPYAETQN